MLPGGSNFLRTQPAGRPHAPPAIFPGISADFGQQTTRDVDRRPTGCRFGRGSFYSTDKLGIGGSALCDALSWRTSRRQISWK